MAGTRQPGTCSMRAVMLFLWRLSTPNGLRSRALQHHCSMMLRLTAPWQPHFLRSVATARLHTCVRHRQPSKRWSGSTGKEQPNRSPRYLLLVSHAFRLRANESLWKLQEAIGRIFGCTTYLEDRGRGSLSRQTTSTRCGRPMAGKSSSSRIEYLLTTFTSFQRMELESHDRLRIAVDPSMAPVGPDGS